MPAFTLDRLSTRPSSGDLQTGKNRLGQAGKNQLGKWAGGEFHVGDF